MWEITDSSDILTDSDKKFRFICRLTPAALLVVMHPSGEKYGCGKGGILQGNPFLWKTLWKSGKTF